MAQSVERAALRLVVLAEVVSVFMVQLHHFSEAIATIWSFLRGLGHPWIRLSGLLARKMAAHHTRFE